MSWKSIVTAGLLCVVASPVLAVPTLNVTRTYNQAMGVIEWQVTVTPTSGYTGALAIEAPFTVQGVGAFNPMLRANSSTSETTHSTGDNNGAANQTWYYNVDTNGTTLLWNTKQLASNLEQNPGDNPYTAPTRTDGLWLNTANNRFYASLGSDVSMPTPVKVLHIASNDGVVRWNNLKIEETGAPGTSTLLTGQFTSILRGDMNGNGTRNFLDVAPFGLALNNPAAYAAQFPGLDRVARGDMNTNGALNFLDVSPFGVCLGGGVCPSNPVLAGSGSGGGSIGGSAVVPEPTAMVLGLWSVLAAIGLLRRRG